MPSSLGPEQAEAEIRGQAEAWFARMQRPDAADVASAFEDWRASDPRCQVAFTDLEAKVAFTGLLRFTETGRSRDLGRARASAVAAMPAFYRVAAAALLLLGVAGAASLLHGAPGSTTFVAATRIGQILPQRLADGSVVTLDTDSRIAIDFSGPIRSVRLVRGRARFAVAHDPAHPFVVAAGGRTVTATGTIFDVALYGPMMRVALLRGAVEVTRAATAHGTPAMTARLRPGDVVQAAAGRPGQILTRAARGEDRWVGGMLSFERAPLSEVLAQTNRYSRAKIRLGDPALADRKVSGVFRPVPIEDLAASLTSAFALHATAMPDGSIELRR